MATEWKSLTKRSHLRRVDNLLLSTYKHCQEAELAYITRNGTLLSANRKPRGQTEDDGCVCSVQETAIHVLVLLVGAGLIEFISLDKRRLHYQRSSAHTMAYTIGAPELSDAARDDLSRESLYPKPWPSCHSELGSASST